MAKGGVRARSGPPPDPNALRRERDEGDWVTLPAAGRAGPAPGWPLSKATQRELVLWKGEWKRPQAIMWERLGLAIEVALYVRSLAGAERPKAPVNLRTLVKQQQEALGLSLPGLARNKWKIEEIDERAAAAHAAPTRTRFKVVTGGAG